MLGQRQSGAQEGWGAASRAKGREGDALEAWQGWACVSRSGRSVWGCVQPHSCLLGACGGVAALERLSTCMPVASEESRAPHLTAVLGPPAAACDAAVPCRPVAPR